MLCAIVDSSREIHGNAPLAIRKNIHKWKVSKFAAYANLLVGISKLNANFCNIALRYSLLKM